MHKNGITLPGSFDLHIIDTCNLNCKGCIVLDYLQDGRITNTRYELSDVKVVMENLKRLDLRLEELKLLGGEPTLHKNLDEIVDYLNSTHLIDKLTIVTNGLNFTPAVIKTLKKLDTVTISVYPLEQDLGDIIQSSNLYNDLKPHVDIEFWRQNGFHLWGQQEAGISYNAELNWKRCYQKDSCRVITKKHLYRCTTTYSEKTDMCTWDSKQEVIEFISSDKPLNHCKVCPFPPKLEKWESNNLPIDTKNFRRGIELIKKYKQVKRLY